MEAVSLNRALPFTSGALTLRVYAERLVVAGNLICEHERAIEHSHDTIEKFGGAVKAAPPIPAAQLEMESRANAGTPARIRKMQSRFEEACRHHRTGGLTIRPVGRSLTRSARR